MAEEGYPSRLCKSNDFNVYGVFGRDRPFLRPYLCTSSDRHLSSLFFLNTTFHSSRRT
jgi:hypothetical protein